MSPKLKQLLVRAACQLVGVWNQEWWAGRPVLGAEAMASRFALDASG